MSAPDDPSLYEWAEFNVPAELLHRSRIVSPLARRVLAGQKRSPEAAGGTKSLAFPDLGGLLLPGLGIRSLPKP